MAEVPGLKARHTIVTDACRRSRTDAGAIDEALVRLRNEALAVARGRPIGSGVTLHLVLTVELPMSGGAARKEGEGAEAGDV